MIATGAQFPGGIQPSQTGKVLRVVLIGVFGYHLALAGGLPKS